MAEKNAGHSPSDGSPKEQKSARQLSDEQIVTEKSLPRRSFLAATGSVLFAGAAALVLGRTSVAQPQDPDKPRQDDPDKPRRDDPDKPRRDDPDKARSQDPDKPRPDDPDKARPQDPDKPRDPDKARPPDPDKPRPHDPDKPPDPGNNK